MVLIWYMFVDTVQHEINLLHVAHVPLIDQRTCAGLDGYGDKVSKNMVCAGFDDGAVDTCKVLD